MQSASKQDVVDYLIKKNLTPVYVREKGTVERKLKISLFQGISMLDKITLTKHLSAVIRAGLNLREAIEIMIEDTQKPALKKVLSQAKFNLEKGQPLSATFQSFSRYFSPVFVGMVRAGEVSGDLDKNLEDLGNHIAKDHELINRVKSAMVYPILLLVASVFIIFLLLVFILPRLFTVFYRGGLTLPLTTRILVKISDILTFNYFLTFGALFGLAIALWYFLKTAKGRHFLAAFAFHIPVVRSLIKNLALARLTGILSSLLSSGVPIVESLEITATSVANDLYKKIVVNAMEDIKKGAPLAESFKKYPDLFPRLLSSMISIGERTGTLEQVLKTMSDFYNDEVDSTLKSLVALVEPTLLLIMGIIIGTIALSVLMPIYQLVEVIQ